MNLNQLTITKIVDVLPVFQKQGTKVTIQNRKSYALSFCKNGKITYNHKGKIYLSDKTKVTFHPQGEEYLLTCNESGEFPLIEFFLSNEPITEFMQFEISSLSAFLDLFEKLKENLYLQNKKAKNLALLYEIFDMLENSNSCKNNILTPALDYISDNYTCVDLSIQTLSSLCHVSECYFRRLFREQFKTSPKQYIISLKIAKAKQLLKESIYSVTEIANQCGFVNVFYFSKTFKTLVGSTPSEFIKNNAKRIL